MSVLEYSVHIRRAVGMSQRPGNLPGLLYQAPIIQGGESAQDLPQQRKPRIMSAEEIKSL